MSFQNDKMPREALAVLDAARDCDHPTPEDRARITAAMGPKLAALGVVPAVFIPVPLAAAPAVTGAAAAAGASGLGLGAKLALVLVGASVAAGGTMYGLHARESARAPVHAPAQAARADRAAEHPAAAAASAAPALQPEPSPAEAPATEAPTAKRLAATASVVGKRPVHTHFAAPHRAPRAQSVTASAPAAPPTQNTTSAEPLDPSLREELAIIARANTALRLEHPADALRALDEHASRFQNGVLSEERRGLRVLALCALAPNQAALNARDTFLRASPHALLAPKVRAACTKDPRGAR